MLDFFKDLYLEANGIDAVAAEKNRNEKREIAKTKRYIFTNKMKALILALGILYLIMAVSSLIVLKSKPNVLIYLIKYIVLSFFDIGICICLFWGGKKGEIAAIIGIFLFIAMNYLALFLI